MVMVQGRSLTLVLGKYTTVFHTQMYDIEACAVDNLDRDGNNRDIYLYILSDCQAAIKAPDNYQSNSELVSDCHQTLMKLVNVTQFN